MKYILEIKPEYEDSFKGVMILGAKDSNLFVDTLAVENLEELNADYINEHFGDLQDTAYQKGINDGSLDVKQRVEGAYQRGFEDGKWKSEDGCTGCKYEGKTGEHLPCDYCMNNFKNQWTAKKQDDKIEVGDEVNNIYSKLKGVVTQIIDDTHMYALWQDGSTGIWNVNEVTKTGRHFDIASILEEMRND